LNLREKIKIVNMSVRYRPLLQYQKALALLTVGLETGLRVGFAVTGLRVGLGVAQSTDNLNVPSAEL